MSEDEGTYTEEQVKQYADEMVRQYAQGKSDTHTFFTKVIQNDDTIKTGNVSKEELGNPQFTVRGAKELELFSRDIYLDETWGDYFSKMAEIATSTSLSEGGFLLKLSVTNKKELADVTAKPKKNKGWFKKKSDSGD